MPDDAAGLRAANSRLRGRLAERDAEVAALRAGLDTERELRRRLELRLAELERRLGMDSTDSGTPSSKERIGAKEARRARRQESERERRKDRERGGQPGHPGKGLARDPDPDGREEAPPPAECRRCGVGLDGAAAAGRGWAQVIDVEIVRKVTEWALPGLSCPCCGTVTFAAPPPGAHAGSVSYGAVLNAAAVLLTSFGNVPPERAARVIGMLFGTEVSAGFVDKREFPAVRAGGEPARRRDARGAGRREGAGRPRDSSERAGQGHRPAAPGARGRRGAGPGGEDKAAAGAPHVLIVRTPDGRLTWLQAIGSRRKGDVAAGIPGVHRVADHRRVHGIPAPAGAAGRIQQCCAHVIRPAAASPSSAPAACSPGQATSSRSCARRTGPWKRPAPAATPAWTRSCSMTCANATTRRSGPGSSITGYGNGTTGTTPATRSAPGCATTGNRSSCSPGIRRGLDE